MKSRLLLALALACSSPAPKPVAPPAPPPAPADAALPADAAPGVSLPSAPEPVPVPLPVALDAALAKRIDPVIDKAFADGRAVGVVVVIARDGAIVYQRAAGQADREAKLPVREDTMFRLGSMTKPITSATALALVDQGKLSLDDPVTKYLPDFRPKLGDGREPVITIRHLMTHTSGLTYKFAEKAGGPYHLAEVSDGLAEPAFRLDDNLRRLASVPLIAEPGKAFHYGLSSDVLGAVIARAGGDELPALVARLVTRPLGMTDTTFAVTDRARLAWPYLDLDRRPVRMGDPQDMRTGKDKSVRFSPSRIFDSASYPSGGAGLAATARDYVRFAEALRTGKILKPETLRAMLANQLGDRPGPDEGWGYGLGVAVMVDPAQWKVHFPAGTFRWAGIFGTKFWVDPTARLTVVILTNVAGGAPLISDLEKALYPSEARGP